MNASMHVEPAPAMADRVYAVLHEAITSGEFPVGHRLRIRPLAAQVGTSEMPVREAIRRLEEAGFAERVPHKGAVVRGLRPAELVHVYDVRRLLEVEAARSGAERIGAEQIARMRTELRAMRRAIDEGDVIGCLDRDEALLAVLYGASGNPVLLDTISTLWQHCRAYKAVGARASLGRPGDALWRYQQRLVEAVAAHDTALAAALTEESLVRATDRIREKLQARQ